jgi:hypothetical protein
MFSKLINFLDRQKPANKEHSPPWRNTFDIYTPSISESELRQGEIITGLTYYSYLPTEEEGKILLISEDIPYSVVATPDCDLHQLYKFGNDKKKILDVLLYPAEELGVFKPRIEAGTKEIKQMMQNRIEQIHYIDPVDSQFDLKGDGIPELFVDFKRYYSLPYPEIMRQIGAADPASAKRRCRLNDNWRENFRWRAMTYFGRVGVPVADDES